MKKAAPHETDLSRITTCRICAGQCGIIVDLDAAGRVDRVRGDPDNPLTRGYACIKGLTLGEAHSSPTRILHPLRRTDDGRFVQVGMNEALDEIAERLGKILAEHGPDAVAGFRGTMNYTNSLAAHMLPAWLAVSLILAAIVCNNRISILRHPLLIRIGLIAACVVFYFFVTRGIVI